MYIYNIHICRYVYMYMYGKKVTKRYMTVPPVVGPRVGDTLVTCTPHGLGPILGAQQLDTKTRWAQGRSTA